MSKLDELIAELCPDGVESKPLSEIATITRGGNLQKKDFTESGVPCIHYGQIYTKYGLFTDRTYTFVSESTASKQKKAVPGDIVMAVTSENIEDVCKCVVWLGDGDVAVSGLFAYLVVTFGADLAVSDVGDMRVDDGEVLLELGDLLNYLRDILSQIHVLSGRLIGQLAKLDQLLADSALDALSGDFVL